MRRAAIASLVTLVWLVAGCTATPQPRSPRFDPEPACASIGLPSATQAALLPVPAWPTLPAAPPVDSAGAAGRDGDLSRFAPEAAAAARYNDPSPPLPHSALGDAVLAAVRDAAARSGVATPAPDARLFQACADLAAIVPSGRFAGARLDDAAIEFALQRNGLIEPSVHLLFGWADLGAPERFVRELQPKLAAALRDAGAVRVGVGAARRGPDGLGAIVFALQGSAVSTLPIPRGVSRGAEVVIDAVVDPRFHDPEVFVTSPAGDTEQVAVRPGRPAGFVAQVPCGARAGRHQIEILASDATGATVLANFPVWCASEPPRALAIEAPASSSATPAEAERALLDAIDRDRAAAGLPALHRDDALAAVARGHAEAMRDAGAVAHISATTGSAADRLRAAGIETRLVLENVARAPGAAAAHRALMNSPGHRANILSAEATEVGIGVALSEVDGRRELFITQLFTRSAAAGAAHCERSGIRSHRVAAR